MEPLVGLYKPVIKLKTVVLPAPLGPISPTNSPCLIVVVKLTTAFKPPKLRQRLVISNKF